MIQIPKNLVWSAVFSVALGGLSVLTAIFSLPEISVSLGLCAVTSAVLAGRERV